MPSKGFSSFRQCVAIFLSICLGLFLTRGKLRLLNDSLVLICGLHVLTVPSGILSSISLLLLLLVYCLMGLTPIIPKRVFLPIALFFLLALLALFPTDDLLLQMVAATGLDTFVYSGGPCPGRLLPAPGWMAVPRDRRRGQAPWKPASFLAG